MFPGAQGTRKKPSFHHSDVRRKHPSCDEIFGEYTYDYEWGTMFITFSQKVLLRCNQSSPQEAVFSQKR